MKKPNRVIRLTKLVFPTNWPSKWAFPILVFLLSSIFMYGDLGNHETKMTLGLLKDNPNNWNYLTQEGQLYRFLTYSVIHQDIKHYLCNMVNILWMWAISVAERQKRIEITYIIAVVLAGIANLHFTPATFSITIGASAGVMSLAGLYMFKRIEEKDWWSAIFFLVFCTMGDFTQVLQKANVAWIAHCCGLLVGIAFGIFNARIDRKKVEN